MKIRMLDGSKPPKYENTELLKIIKSANKIARKNCYQKATEIIIGNKNRVVSHTDYGFRKYTTGEYVSNAYRHNFGWKNTYYQHAETVVEIESI